MYINKELVASTPSFRVTGTEYTETLKLIKNDKESDSDLEVAISLLVRTDRTNEVLLVEDNSTVLNLNAYGVVNPEVPFDTYVNLMQSCKVLFDPLVTPEFTLKELKQTVNMPMGFYIHEDKVHFYFNLVIKEELKSLFTKPFIQIEDLGLKNLNEKSIIVLPTLVKTK